MFLKFPTDWVWSTSFPGLFAPLSSSLGDGVGPWEWGCLQSVLLHCLLRAKKEVWAERTLGIVKGKRSLNLNVLVKSHRESAVIRCPLGWLIFYLWGFGVLGRSVWRSKQQTVQLLVWLVKSYSLNVLVIALIHWLETNQSVETLDAVIKRHATFTDQRRQWRTFYWKYDLLTG